MVARFCPRCRIELEDFQADPHTRVGVCPSCKSLWIAPAELARFAGVATVFPDWSRSLLGAVPSRTPCPACSPRELLLSVPLVPDAEKKVLHCKRCEGFWLEEGELQECRRVLRAQSVVPDDTGPDPQFRFALDGPRLRILAPPLILFLALVLLALPIVRSLFWVWFALPMHELGHALAAGPSHSFLRFFVLSTLAGLLGFRAWRRGYRFFSVLAWSYFGASVWLSLLASGDQQEGAYWYAGPAGEIILATILTTAFYAKLPDRLRWDFFRFPAALIGTYVLFHNLDSWGRIQYGIHRFVRDTTFGGTGDRHGDFRWMVEHGWTSASIAGHFVWLSRLGAAIALGVYLFFALPRRESK